MKKISKLLFALTVLLTTAGCSIYHPQLANVPLIEHKGDTRVAASLHFLSGPGLSTTISTGLTDHLAAQVHASFDGPDVFYTHMAVGLYLPHEKGVFETYLGLGRGNGDVYIDADPASARGPYMCHFLQFNYGWKLSEKSTIGVSFKGGALWPRVRWSGSAYDAATDSWISVSGVDDNAHALLEPQIFYRVGNERLKFQVQLGYSYVSFPRDIRALRYSPLCMSTGVSINL